MIINYTKEKWVPQTKVLIVQQQEKIREKITSMGMPDTSSLSEPEQQDLLKELCGLVVSNFTSALKYEEIANCFPKSALKLYDETTYESLEAWMKWKQDVRAITVKGYSNLAELLINNSVKYLNSTNRPMIVSRFATFRECVKAALRTVLKPFIKECKERFEVIITDLIFIRFSNDVEHVFIQGDCRARSHTTVGTAVQHLAVTIGYEWLISGFKNLGDALIDELKNTKISKLLEDSTQPQRDQHKAQLKSLQLTLKEIEKLLA
jgi:hypothetical protein